MTSHGRGADVELETLVDASAELPDQVFRPDSGRFLYVENDMLWSSSGWDMLADLAVRSGDERIRWALTRLIPDSFGTCTECQYPELSVPIASGHEGFQSSMERWEMETGEHYSVAADAWCFWSPSGSWATWSDRDLELSIIWTGLPVTVLESSIAFQDRVPGLDGALGVVGGQFLSAPAPVDPGERRRAAIRSIPPAWRARFAEHYGPRST